MRTQSACEHLLALSQKLYLLGAMCCQGGGTCQYNKQTGGSCIIAVGILSWRGSWVALSGAMQWLWSIEMGVLLLTRCSCIPVLDVGAS